MMNVENQELMTKIKNNTLQRRKDAKMFSEHYNDCIIRVSNFIRLVDENHIRFDPPRGHMKSVLKEEWNIVGKIYDSNLNYCQVVILENPSEYLGVKIGSTWKIEKAALKRSKKSFK